MRLKKFAAVILSASVILSVTGCDGMGIISSRNKTQNEFIEVLKDSGFKTYEKKRDVKKGVYASTKKPNEIEDFFDIYEFPEPDEDDIYRVSYGMMAEEDGDRDSQLVAFLAEFKDSDDAEDYFDDLLDFYSDVNDQYEQAAEFSPAVTLGFDDDDESFYIALYIAEGGECVSITASAILDDANLYFLLDIGYNDLAEDYRDIGDDIWDDLGFDKPSDLI